MFANNYSFHINKTYNTTVRLYQQLHGYTTQQQRFMSMKSGKYNNNHNSPSRLMITGQLFRHSKIVRDWHQHLDHQTGKFYYINIFSGEKTDQKPKEYLPYDAVQDESLAALRSNQFQQQKKPRSIVRPLALFVVIAGCIYVAEKYGRIDDLLGLTPPPRQHATIESNIYERTKQKMVNFQNYKE